MKDDIKHILLTQGGESERERARERERRPRTRWENCFRKYSS